MITTVSKSPNIFTNVFPLMRIFKIYSLSKFHYYFNNVQYNIINYSHHVLHYTSYLFYNWNFVSFDTLHPFHSPSTPKLWQPPYLFSVS